MIRNVVRKEVKKLYHGYLVSIRDYELKKALDFGGMIIMHNKQIMYLNKQEELTIIDSINQLEKEEKSQERNLNSEFSVIKENQNQEFTPRGHG